MQAIGNYFSNLIHDINVQRKIPDDTRMGSIFLRVIGGVVAAVATLGLIANIAKFPVSPVTSCFGIVAAIVCLIMAHDLIKMGNNERRFLTDPTIDPATVTIGRVISSAWNTGRQAIGAGLYESENNIPHIFQGTIILGRLVKLLKA